MSVTLNYNPLLSIALEEYQEALTEETSQRKTADALMLKKDGSTFMTPGAGIKAVTSTKNEGGMTVHWTSTNADNITKYKYAGIDAIRNNSVGTSEQGRETRHYRFFTDASGSDDERIAQIRDVNSIVENALAELKTFLEDF